MAHDGSLSLTENCVTPELLLSSRLCRYKRVRLTPLAPGITSLLPMRFVLFITATLNWLIAFASPLSADQELQPRATHQGIDQQTYDKLVLKLDYLKDALIWRKSLHWVPGLSNVGFATAHSGFMSGFNAVGKDVLGVVSWQTSQYPSYRIVLTGHSLGGAIASLGALVVKSALPQANVVLYTYGQPRVGNTNFASYLEKMIGVNNVFRVVHTTDSVPLIFLRITGYRHFGTEYWNFKDPASPATVTRCNGGEDPNCSRSQWPIHFDTHDNYFGIILPANNGFCS
ncbi:unnamed protein product [Cyclocybe aegerita]|uniref:Fungal lipase-type domain-containing protein n=1 Tax=Cyclocybe aegerita TaxID=1973307 RepID=A0A8S0X1V5_CYCAE|nr:unnamed protein product [Cyclocybe aegerita]